MTMVYYELELHNVISQYLYSNLPVLQEIKSYQQTNKYHTYTVSKQHLIELFEINRLLNDING
jgi:hypothetical protein